MAHHRHGRRAITRAGLAAAALVCSAVLSACGPSSPGAAGGGLLSVVAAENFWGDIATQIGGGHVTVTSIVSDPTANPHGYETDPRDAALVSNAAIVIENGLGYDDFIDKLLRTKPHGGRDVVSIAATVAPSGDNPNPHLWYNPAYVKAAAQAIESRFAARDPGDAGAFAASLQRFLTGYQPYIDTLAAIRGRHAGSPIAYTERVPGYLVEQAGLRLATPPGFAQSIEDGNDPAPADAAAMSGAMEQRAVKVLLYNSQVTSPTTQKVRELAGAHRVPLVGVSETIPAGKRSFQAWQVEQATSILRALGG